jgi:hypothetical protein
MLNVIILSVVTLSVMAPLCFKAYGKGFKLNCISNLFHASNHHKAALILAKFNAKISAKMSVVKDAILPALATLVDATKIGSYRVASSRVVRGKYAWPIEIGLEHAPFVVLIFFFLI